MSAIVSSTQPTTCVSNGGGLLAAISGGTAPYSFHWTDESGKSINLTDNPTTLSAGSYELTITDDNGCVFKGNYTLSDPNAPAITLVNVIAVTCYNPGGIDVNINPISSKIWSNSETTEDLTNLTAGFYSIAVEDDSGCVGTYGVNVLNKLLETIEICMVSIDTLTNTNLIIWEKPVTTEIDYFIVYRETSVAGEFLPAYSIDYDEESIFTDPVTYPQLKS
jgi:hypothetical protein